VTQVNQKNDYIADIEISSEELAKVLQWELHNKYCMATKTVSAEKDSFISHVLVSSLLRALFKAIHEHIERSIKTVTPKTCRLIINYGLTSYVKMSLYALCLIIGVTNLFVYLLFSNYSDFTTERFLVQHSGGINILMMVYFGVGIIVFCFEFMFICLLWRYKLFGQRVLRIAFSNLKHSGNSIRFESPILAGRHIINKMIVVLPAGLLIIPPVIFDITFIWNILRQNYELIFLSIAFLLLLTLFRKGKRQFFKIGKVSPITGNVLLILIVMLILFFLPLNMVRCSRIVLSTPGHFSLITQEDYLKSPDMQARINLMYSRTDKLEIAQKVNRQCITMILASCLLFAISITLLFYCSKILIYFTGGIDSLHQKSMKGSFYLETNSSDNETVTLGLSTRSKIIVWFVFVIFSGLCWSGVFLNISILNAFIFPNFKLVPLTYGETVVKGTLLISSAVSGIFEDNWRLYLFQWILVLPLVLPFLLFVFLNLRCMLFFYKKSRKLVPIKTELTRKVSEIARDMGVVNVECLLDEESGHDSPTAKIRGLVAKKQIIFSQTALAFIDTYPEYIEAIIAHEVAHLKYDCRFIQKMTALSRLGLVGCGFLSVLHDSIAIEKRANNKARDYLEVYGMDVNMINTIVPMIKFHGYLALKKNVEETPLSVAFTSSKNSRAQTTSLPKNFSGRVFESFRIAYKVYFETDMFDYLH